MTVKIVLISPVVRSSVQILEVNVSPSEETVLYTSRPLKFKSAHVTGPVVLFGFSVGMISGCTVPTTRGALTG